jgi:hypothetical protein
MNSTKCSNYCYEINPGGRSFYNKEDYTGFPAELPLFPILVAALPIFDEDDTLLLFPEANVLLVVLGYC